MQNTRSTLQYFALIFKIQIEIHPISLRFVLDYNLPIFPLLRRIITSAVHLEILENATFQ